MSGEPHWLHTHYNDAYNADGAVIQFYTGMAVTLGITLMMHDVIVNQMMEGVFFKNIL